MTPQHVDILFQMIVFLFAISVHESAHAWMANLRGDPTARMLGRITLNPIKHIDPVGTILLPTIALLTGFPLLGWAKPTPVNPANFKNPMLDDILTAVIGPISNFVLATLALLAMLGVGLTSPEGHRIVQSMPFTYALGLVGSGPDTALVPIVLFLYELMLINILLGVFNLIPVPPLDGSHVLRHFLKGAVGRAYDAMGMIGLIVLVYFGQGVLNALIMPFFRFYNSILTRG